MKNLAGFTTLMGALAGALALLGCASSLPKPQEYGFRSVPINGRQYFCAPTRWVVPPVAPAWVVSAADSSGDIPSGFFALAYPDTREICLTQAQWPTWLMVRNKFDREWPITPAAAAALASP